jgi:RNA polymerase sigma-70 factor (ECF subfamily)
MQMETDIELMRRVKSGDNSAFTELMKRHYKSIMNYIYRFTNDRNDSEDLAQEVFLRVYRSVNEYKPRAKFSTWLYKIATNVCLTEIKLKGRMNKVSLDEIQENKQDIGDSNSPTGYDLIEKREIKDSIFQALNSIPENERISIILCKYEGLSYDEVAGVIGCTVGAVKTYIHRGRMKLIERLKPILEARGEHEL